MPKLDLHDALFPADVWNPTDLVLAARDLRRQYPEQPENVIVAAVQTAANIIAPSRGRVLFVQVAREVLRAN